MPKAYFPILFIVIAAIELFVIQYDLPYRAITKPLIVISLIAYYIGQMSAAWSSTDTLFLAALVFALGGDILLLWDELFVFGLGSFLIMQLLYILAFKRGTNYYGSREFIYAGILIFFVVLIISQLWSELGSMTLAVLIYSLAICFMSWTAWTRDFTRAGYRLIWIGTVFFIVSDMSIALQTFGGMNLGKLTVMSTYAIAQLLIVLGFVSYRQA